MTPNDPARPTPSPLTLTPAPYRFSRRRFLSGLAAAGALTLAACSNPGDLVSRMAEPSPAEAASFIEHVVIFMKENHTYDNLFGLFPGGRGVSTGSICEDQLPTDLSHKHEAALAGATPLGHCQYTKEQLPSYWAYAQNFTLCDNFFTEVMGPSPANHLMVIAAQAPFVDYPPGMTAEAGWTCPGSCWDFPTIFDRLEEKGLTWRNYWAAPWSDTFMVQHLIDSPNNVPYQQFLSDAAAGNLPHVSYVKTSAETSDHPPQSLTVGENYQVAEINAIVQGGLWDKTAIFITWDDWGGFYDHVIPPVVESWTDGTPFRYGPRTPLLVMGGYARRHHISHRLGSFVSLTRFCERIFDLEPLTERDAAAHDLLDCFNFSQPPRAPLMLQQRPANPHPLPANPYVP